MNEDDKSGTGLKEAVTEETPLHVEVNEPEEDFRYGWGNFRPRALQFLNNPKLFTVTVSLFSFMQGTIMCINQSKETKKKLDHEDLPNQAYFSVKTLSQNIIERRKLVPFILLLKTYLILLNVSC